MFAGTRLRCVPVTLQDYCAKCSTANAVRKGGQVKFTTDAAARGERHWAKARLGNAASCRKATAEAIAKRAYEIYENRGCRPGQDRNNGRVAESELVQPLPCM